MVEFSCQQSINLLGAAIHPCYDARTKSFTFAPHDKLFTKDLLTKHKFITALNLRKVINLIQGITEDPFDQMTKFEEFQSQEMMKEFSLVECVDCFLRCGNFAIKNVDEFKLETIKKVTFDGAGRFIHALGVSGNIGKTDVKVTHSNGSQRFNDKILAFLHLPSEG